MSKVKVIDVVYADWCPHCVPTTTEPMKKAAAALGVRIHLYNIDTADMVRADELVEKYGDWSPDYLIPQVFVEFDDGEIRHVLTGHPQGVSYTRKAVENLLKTPLFKNPG